MNNFVPYFVCYMCYKNVAFNYNTFYIWSLWVRLQKTIIKKMTTNVKFDLKLDNFFIVILQSNIFKITQFLVKLRNYSYLVFAAMHIQILL